MATRGRAPASRSCWMTKCGHPECRRASQDYRHEDYRLRRLAVGKVAYSFDLVKPDRARAHIADLGAAGMAPYAVARACGVRVDTVMEIVRGARPRIASKTEARILAVAPAPTRVDSTGASRRLRALAVMGYGVPELAAATGIHPDLIKKMWQGRYPTTRRENHEKVAAAYQELLMIPGPSDRARSHAARYGWVPPLAWDEDTIDDPSAKPDLGAPSRGFDLDEWEFLLKSGEDPRRAADRCGVKLSAVAMAAYRAGRPELAQIAESHRKRWSVPA